MEGKGWEDLMKINLGAGGTKIPGFISVDAVSERRPDVCANIQTYLASLENESVDEIYASHVLEHLSFLDATYFANDSFRVLKRNGILWIAVPNFRLVCKQVADGYDSPYITGMIYGGDFSDYDRHRSYWSRKSIERFFSIVGFVDFAEFEPWVKNEDNNGYDASCMWFERTEHCNERIRLSLNVKMVKR